MAAVDDLYAELRPLAAQQFSKYIMTRTPPALQAGMATLVGNDALVAEGDEVAVTDDGVPITGSPGTAVVAAGVLTTVAVLTP